MNGFSRNKWVLIGTGVIALFAFGALLYKTTMVALAPKSGAPAPSGQVAPNPATSKTAAAAATPASGQSQAKPSAAQAPASLPAPTATPAQPGVPSFDVVRVEPTGETVVAGRAAPGARVTLMNSGKPAGAATADPGGQFVILPQALPPGAHNLSLAIEGPGGQNSRQSVAVAVPKTSGGEVMVALAEPDKPTVVLSQRPTGQRAVEPSTPAPQTAPQIAHVEAPVGPAASPSSPQVKFSTVEADDAGGFLASGQATPGAQLRVYLNNIFIAEVRAGPDGKWSIKVNRGLKAGDYSVRADQVDSAGKVASRAEVPFAMAKNSGAPVQTAKATTAAPTAAPVPSAGTPPVGGSSAAPSPSARPQTLTGQPSVIVAKPVPVHSQAREGAPAGQADQPDASAPKRTVTTALTAAAQPAPATGGPVAAPAGASAQPSESHVVIEQVRTANVVRGDSLWRISRKMLGQGIRYTQIYEANNAQIRNPHRIYPGQVLVVPKQGG